MFSAVLNVFLYLGLLVIYRKKTRGVDIYQIIVLLYLCTAVLCSVNYAHNYKNWPDLGFFPFVYLFMILVIMFRPLQYFSLEKRITPWKDNGSLYVLGCIYIILAILDTYFSINGTITRFSEGDWGMLRAQMYQDEESIELYSNIWEKLTKNILGYLHPFAIVYAFFQATLNKRPLFTGLLFLSIIIPSFISATVVASRGMVFELAMELMLGFWLFKKEIPKHYKKMLYMGSFFIGSLFLVYSVLVSVSRFGEDEAGNSVFEYFGHSMLSFNDGIYNNLHDFAYGKRFFSFFIDLFGGNSAFDAAKAGATHGSSFFTIVGSLYVDWGWIGTIIVAILTCWIIVGFTQKKRVMLSDMVIIFFYIKTLASGIFVFGKGRALIWIMTFVVFFIVRAMEKRKETYVK